MEFVAIIIIVGIVSVALGLRAYRFWLSATKSPKGNLSHSTDCGQCSCRPEDGVDQKDPPCSTKNN